MSWKLPVLALCSLTLAGAARAAEGVSPATLPVAAATTAPALAATTAPTTAPSTRPIALGEDLPMGQRFVNKIAGIAFDPPPQCERSKRPGVVENVVHYRNEANLITLTVTRMILGKPLRFVQPIAPARVPASGVLPDEKPAEPAFGLLDMMENELVRPPLNAVRLRKDVITGGTHGDTQIGMLAGRYVTGPRRFLKQQAFVLVNQPGISENQFYFMFDFTTPTTPDWPATAPDPAERAAVELFRRVLDSVEIFDMRAVIREQEDRLFRTRTLFVNLTEERVTKALQPEQGYLYLRDGKPVGYTYVYEEIGKRGSDTGVIIDVRAYSESPDGPKVTAAHELFATVNRKQETWASVLNTHDVARDQAGKPILDAKGMPQPFTDHFQEVGTSVMEARRVFQRDPLSRVEGFTLVDRYALIVNQSTPAGTRRPVERELAPYYLPQAFSHLFPRLLPLVEPKGFEVVIWVSSEGEVIRRYLDVEQDRRVTIGGKPVRAIAVKDQIGQEGVPTYHYFALEGGKYLGSMTEANKTMVVPVDKATILERWPTADLSPPHELKKVREGGAAGGPDNRGGEGRINLPAGRGR